MAATVSSAVRTGLDLVVTFSEDMTNDAALVTAANYILTPATVVLSVTRDSAAVVTLSLESAPGGIVVRLAVSGPSDLATTTPVNLSGVIVTTAVGDVVPDSGIIADSDTVVESSTSLPSDGVSLDVDYSGDTSDVESSITDVAYRYLARSVVEGLAIRIVGWQAGSGGFYKNSPITAMPVNTSSVSLISKEYPVGDDYAAITQVEYPTATGHSLLLRAAPSVALKAWGEIAIIAEVYDSPVDPTENGTLFLFSIVHMPIQAKSSDHVYNYRVIHQFGGV